MRSGSIDWSTTTTSSASDLSRARFLTPRSWPGERIWPLSAVIATWGGPRITTSGFVWQRAARSLARFPGPCISGAITRIGSPEPTHATRWSAFSPARHTISSRAPLAGSVPVFVWGAGQTGRRLSKHLKRFGAALQAFIDIDPRKIGKTLRGLPISPIRILAKAALHRGPRRRSRRGLIARRSCLDPPATERLSACRRGGNSGAWPSLWALCPRASLAAGTGWRMTI